LKLQRVATIAVVIATAWFAVAISWGFFGPVTGGHMSVVGSRGIMGENMVLWHIWGPVREYTFEKPVPSQHYYPDHPFGTYWVIGALVKVFGRHPFVPRIEPILLSVATPPLLYAIGRSLWGHLAGAICAIAYTVLPIALAFGNFPGFEVALIFGCLVTMWGYIHFTEKWKARWLLVSLAGVTWTANTDWQGSVFLGAVLASLLVTHYLLPRWFGNPPARPFGQWWTLTASITAVTVLVYMAYFVHIEAVDKILAQEALRERGREAPLLQVLGQRGYWIDLAFTPVGVTIGKIALPIFLFRVIFLRRTVEVFPLAILLMSAISYARFKNGADAHFYWPQPFAPYCAMSFGIVFATALALGKWLLAHYGRADPRNWLPTGTFAAAGVLVLLMLPDGVRGLAYARATGGRFNDRGRRIFQDLDKSVALEWMSQQMRGLARVQLHTSMHWNWANDWALHRPVAQVDGLPSRAAPPVEDRYFVANLAFVNAADQQKLAAQFHLVEVGQYALVDRAAPWAPADGYVLDSREPTPLEWYFVSGVDPILSVRPDPWTTWEVREQFSQGPNPAPASEPRILEELRIAHNVAVAANDSERADALEAKLVAQLEVYPATKFTDGTQLLGVRFVPGVAPRLEVYFEAAGPTPDEDQFDIESFVQRRPIVSLLAGDERVRTIGRPLVPPPKLWKPHFVYVDRTEIRQRPGQEMYLGFFTAPEKARPPMPLDGSTKIRLLTLP
jgi:hypothetical protein